MANCWVRRLSLRQRSLLRPDLNKALLNIPRYWLRMGTTTSSEKRHRHGAEAFVESVERVAGELRRARQRAPHVLSDAYEAAAREHTSSLVAVLKALECEDFSLQRRDLESPEHDREGTPSLHPGQWPEECNWPVRPIQYVYGAEYPGLFSVGVFVLPKGAYLPLHDHFGMVVVSRVLWGSLIMRALDFDNPSTSTDYSVLESHHQEGGWARSVLERCERRAGDTWVLYPKSGGNIHEIVALNEPCAMLDVIMPPYPAPSIFLDQSSEHELYQCHYYRAKQRLQSEIRDSNSRWFLERFLGDDLVYVQRARQRFLPGLWRFNHR
ncbi:hypothetical protein CCYA_CCYA13G3580 [Cyanidiococcus yangmingshanensis]|nr:hypothetical protein CCYA_CCYA13G3580 [Cyanidiococcus yangmingshanensis]